MNENHPDFMGPRRRRLRMDDPTRPIGVPPQEWAARKASLYAQQFGRIRRAHVPLPPKIRNDDRRPWKPGFLISGDWGAIEAVIGETKEAVAHADPAISRMLSGKLPRGAGANTEAVSEAFCALAMHPDATVVVADPRLAHPVFIRPYDTGLHELRAARGRRI